MCAVLFELGKGLLAAFFDDLQYALQGIANHHGCGQHLPDAAASKLNNCLQKLNDAYILGHLNTINTCNIYHLPGHGYIACNALRANRQL